MTTTHARRLTALTAAAALSLAIGSPLAAKAEAGTIDADMQARVNAVLAAHPGGVQIAANEVAWDGGDVILTLAPDDGGYAPLSVGSCSTGAFCADEGYSLSGDKLSFTSCTAHSTAFLGTVRSVANARSSGSIKARDSGGSVLVTVSAGGSSPYAPAGITELTCGS